MTPNEFAKQLESKIDELRANNRPLGIAVATVVAESAQRIFVQGRNNVGETFKYNDVDPMYLPNPDNNSGQYAKAWIQARQQSVMTGKGKYGESTFKSGKKKGQKHLTTYFESYKEFRELQGLESNYVNWQYNNDLQSDYSNSVSTDPKQAKAVKIDSNEYQMIIREENINKYKGLSSRYGKFLNISDSEKARFYEIQEKELADYLSR